jgi:hypothetical protein
MALGLQRRGQLDHDYSAVREIESRKHELEGNPSLKYIRSV